MFRTRRELEARIFTRSVQRRRTEPHREPSLYEIVAGVSVFVTVAAGCLYLVAWLGR